MTYFNARSLGLLLFISSLEATTEWIAADTSPESWIAAANWNNGIPSSTSGAEFSTTSAQTFTVTDVYGNCESITVSGPGSVVLDLVNYFYITTITVSDEFGLLTFSGDILDTLVDGQPVILNGPGSVAFDDIQFSKKAVATTLNLETDVTLTLDSTTTVVAEINIFSGSTLTVDGAELVGSIVGSGVLNLTGKGATINPVESSIFSGTITGTGTLTITDDYYYDFYDTTLTLEGANDFSGDIVISHEKVSLSGSGSFEYANSLTMSDSEAGFEISDISTTLANINTLSGEGTITLGTRYLSITQNSNEIFAGTIEGTGGLIKAGSAALTLSKDSSYTGLTTIVDGDLIVNGTITSDVIIESGGTLSGSGVQGSVTNNDGGTYSPGNSPGISTVRGDLLLESGSFVNIVVAGIAGRLSGETDTARIRVTGNSTLDGALNVAFESETTNLSVGDFFVITSGGSTSGTFTTTNVNPAGTYGVTISGISYDGSGAPYFSISVNAPTRPSRLSRNAGALFDRLSEVYSDPLYATIFQKIAHLESLDPSGTFLDAELTMLTPARNAAATFVSSNAQFSAINVLSSRSATWRFWNALGQQQPSKEVALLEEELLVSNADQPFKKGALNAPSCVLNMGRPGDRYAVWFNPFGDISHVSTAAGAEVPFHTYTGGGVVGVDRCISDFGIIEAAVGAARTSVIITRGHQTVNYYLAALNGTYTIDNFYIEAGVMGSYDQLEHRRAIHFDDINRTTSSSHNMWQLTPQLSFGYLCWAASWGLEPFIAEDWVFNFEQKNIEHGGADLDTSTNNRNSSLLRSELGLNIYKDYTFANKCVLLFRATGAYVNQLPFNIGKMTVNFYQTGIGTFEVNSLNKTQNLGMAGAEIVYGATNGLFTSIQYDGEFGRGYSANELQLQVGYSF